MAQPLIKDMANYIMMSQVVSLDDYSTCTGVAKTEEWKTPSFDIFQGDTLSPQLFQLPSIRAAMDFLSNYWFQAPFVFPSKFSNSCSMG